MIINNLFHKLRMVLQKRTGPMSPIVPFALGRVYQCYYRNWKHDPRPLVFVIGSDAFYTVAVNVHYLGAFQHALTSFIMMLRESNMVLTGYILYQMLKRRIPMVPKIAFRKYFTSMLRGKLVSEGVSVLPEPNKAAFFLEPWVVQLNRLIRPPIFSFNKTQYFPHETNEIRSQIIQTQYYKDRQKPFANRKLNQAPPLPNQPNQTNPPNQTNTPPEGEI